MSEFVHWTCRNGACDKHDASDIRARLGAPIKCVCGVVTVATAHPCHYCGDETCDGSYLCC